MQKQQIIGVLGAGQMGCGIAQVCAQHGSSVLLYDQQCDYAIGAPARIEKSLLKMKDKLSISDADIAAALGSITVADTIDALRPARYLIEAISESMEAKQQLFAELERVVDADAIIMSNTSSLRITQLANALNDPSRFCGMHFMNPAPLMPLVEIIAGASTSPSVMQSVEKLSLALGKVPIASGDSPGFVVNRILMPMINEACYVCYQSIASIDAIDKAMTLGLSHPMGALSLADLIGIDICHAVLCVLHEELGDDKYAPCPLLSQMLQANMLGRKTKLGFYDYRGDVPAPNEEIERLIKQTP